MEQGSAELFTVQQFALQVGKTSQAIYQQARGKLKPYVRKGESGQVYITADALKLYKADKPTEAAAVGKDNQFLQSEVNRLKAENEGLLARIENLELHIEELNEATEAAEDANKANEAEIAGLEREIDRLTMERDNLRDQLAREQEISRERLTRLEAADRRIDSLLDKIPPMLPSGNGGGLFGWFKRKKGDTTA